MLRPCEALIKPRKVPSSITSKPVDDGGAPQFPQFDILLIDYGLAEFVGKGQRCKLQVYQVLPNVISLNFEARSSAVHPVMFHLNCCTINHIVGLLLTYGPLECVCTQCLLEECHLGGLPNALILPLWWSHSLIGAVDVIRLKCIVK